VGRWAVRCLREVDSGKGRRVKCAGGSAGGGWGAFMSQGRSWFVGCASLRLSGRGLGVVRGWELGVGLPAWVVRGGRGMVPEGSDPRSNAARWEAVSCPGHDQTWLFASVMVRGGRTRFDDNEPVVAAGAAPARGCGVRGTAGSALVRC